MKNPYTIINASAGSGKTYALVQRVLMLCLQSKNEKVIQHILALTFTNKAANEMKERILEWLESFTKEDYKDNQNLINIQNELKTNGIKLTIDDLHERSKNVLNFILHNYSTLNIGTIDKFNSRLVRSFSYELGLPHQFNLEIQNEPYLIEAVDKTLNEVGENEEISKIFIDFINYKLEQEEKVNISNSLYSKAKNFINDIHYQKLKDNSEFNLEAYNNAKNQLEKEIKIHKQNGKAIAQEAINLIKDNGLEEDDFSQKSNGIAAFFRKYIDYDNGLRNFPFPGNEEKAMANFLKGTASKKTEVIEAVNSILDNLIEKRSKIIKNYIERSKKKKILDEILPLKINTEIQQKLNEIEEEKDLVLLSKFNILINENLKNEPSAFIYEKIGSKFQHFFFDEFQDTSKMQWDNILPLRDHTISSENSSFTMVGDPKQSIYRFRGGDSELMLNILNKKEKTPVEVSVENLEYNWRSAKNIVAFNNELYDFISKGLAPEHQSLFSDKAKQIPRKDNLGRVKVNLIDYGNNAEFYETLTEQMHRDIQQCLDNGFSFSDITILCRYAKEIKQLSKILGSLEVSILGEKKHIKTISEKGLTLNLSLTLKAVMEYLNWEIQPENKQFLVKALYYLNQLGRIEIKDFTEEVATILALENDDKIAEEIEKKYGLKLNQSHRHHLNLYNHIEYIVTEFSFENKETDFILNFLENLYNFTQNTAMNIKDFIKYWEEEAQQIAIQTSENIDAIRLMTIHASKGLEFPVVFLPMMNGNKDKKFDEWYDLEGFNELKSVNINKFDDKIASYDSDLQQFNDVNIYKNKIDRLCALYVATTRPKEQLFLYLQKGSKTGGNQLEILDFVTTKSASENPNEFDIYEEINHSYQKQTKKSEVAKPTQAIKNTTKATDNKNNIAIATPSKNYQNTQESVRIGILTHEILEQISTEKDIASAIGKYVLEGIITEDEKIKISERLLKVIRDEKYKAYFSDGLKVFNERDIMISENGISKIYRPDRLIETADGIIIIDFKTGAEREKYETQIATYQHALEQLGKKVAKTEIIYI